MALPVSLEAAKRQLKIEADETEQDAEVLDFIREAADWVERLSGHILEAREVQESFTGLAPVSLKAWPIDPAAMPLVQYRQDDGDLVTLEARLNLTSRPVRVLPITGSRWPSTNRQQPFTFTVSIRAGYENPEDVPASLRRAILVLIGAFDDDREGGDTLANALLSAQRLCQRFKRHAL